MNFEFTKDDIGKEFSLKFLPNIDSLQDYIVSVEKFYLNQKEVDKETCYKNNGNRIVLSYSFGLINGEYKIIKLNKNFKNIIELCREGSFYKIDNTFISIDEFESGYTDGKGNLTKSIKSKNFIDLGGPVNLYDLKNLLSIKFKINYIQGFLSFEDIRLEEDSKNLIWDGTEEGKDKVRKFLSDKSMRLV